MTIQSNRLANCPGCLSPQSPGEEKADKGVSRTMDGGGRARSGHGGLGDGRIDEDVEDIEGGLDEDWGHDVDVIELQNRLPDSGNDLKKRKEVGKAAAAAEYDDDDATTDPPTTPGPV